MVKFDKNDIYNYIFGGEFDDKRLDELENDGSFMLSVISTTKDKKMINICNDELLGNLSFVRGLINIFSNDKSFCIKIAELFKENNKNINDNLCVDAIIVNRFHRGLDLKDEFLASAKINLNLTYTMDSLYFSQIIKNKAYFDLFVRRYQDYPELIRYFAKRLSDDILYNIPMKEIDIILHTNFTSEEDYKKYGNSKVIYFILCGVDIPLANYYVKYPEIARDFEKELSFKITKWQEYNINQKNIIIDIIVEYANNEAFNLPPAKCFKYIADKFNIPELKEFSDKFLDEPLDFMYENDDYTKDLGEIERRVCLYLKTGNPDEYKKENNKQKYINLDN